MGASRADLATLQRVRLASDAVDALGATGVPAPPPSAARSMEQRYDEAITDPGLRAATRKYFMDGYHADAVRHACMYLNNLVKSKSRVQDKDGNDLMNHAFGLPDPILRLNGGKTTSDRDEQNGYRLIFGGVMWGLRNPRAHEPMQDDAEAALEMLVLTNHLLRVLARARKKGRRKAA